MSFILYGYLFAKLNLSIASNFENNGNAAKILLWM